MAGLALPKLRWLVAGALAAGAWVAMTEPPGRQGVTLPSLSEFGWKMPDLKMPELAMPRLTTPKAAEPPASRPAEIVTSSIVKPRRPAPRAAYTSSSVNLRARPNTASAIVRRLDGGRPVTVLDRRGKWSLVSVFGQAGWIHGDYLVTDVAPRPKLPVPSPASKPLAVSSPVLPEEGRSRFPWLTGKRPLRTPQTGNCQCPYDLMLSGKACGDHSAYARSAGKTQCYK